MRMTTLTVWMPKRHQSMVMVSSGAVGKQQELHASPGNRQIAHGLDHGETDEKRARDGIRGYSGGGAMVSMAAATARPSASAGADRPERDRHAADNEG